MAGAAAKHPRRAALRASLAARRYRLRQSARPLLQAALASGLAWLVARELLGHAEPIFAPISALVAIGASVGQPWRRALEIVLGVAIGIAVADALAVVLGQGAWQIGVMVLLAMAVAVLVGGPQMFIAQAGISAVLIAALPAADGVESLERLWDTYVGAGAAFVMSVLVLPVRPLVLVRRATLPVIRELAGSLDDTAIALRALDPALAEQALLRGRRTGDLWAELSQAVNVGQQAARVSPVRRHDAEPLVDIAEAVRQLDYAIRDTRVLARISIRVTESKDPAGPDVAPAVEALAQGVRALAGYVEGTVGSTAAVREAADAAARAIAPLSRATDNHVIAHLAGQVRSTVVDLLRATGMPRPDAIGRMLACMHGGDAPA